MNDVGLEALGFQVFEVRDLGLRPLRVLEDQGPRTKGLGSCVPLIDPKPYNPKPCKPKP